MRLFQEGVSNAEIAQRLNRTEQATERKRHLLTARSGGREHFLVTDIAKIIGASDSPVHRWAQAGWLPSTRSGQRSTGCNAPNIRHISREQFCAFLSDERYWGHWFVDHVKAGYWRNLAIHYRGNARLITTVEAGALLGQCSQAVSILFNQGLLPGVRGVGRTSTGRPRGNAIWIRADLIPSEMLPQRRVA